MVPDCYVDGNVAGWMAEDDDPLGCDLQALVVYHLEMPRRSFERECDWLEERAEARAQALLAAARSGGMKFGVVCRESIEAADEAVERTLGSSYLETFLNDTRMVALERIGDAFRRIEASGVRVSPPEAVSAVSVSPAKSFKSERALEAYLRDGRNGWKPSVRLELSASLDGPFEAVEGAALIIRAALSACGPVTAWLQSVRPCKGSVAEARTALRIVKN